MDPKSVTVIYQVFYSVIHFLFSIYELILNVYKNLKNKLFEFYYEVVPLHKIDFQKMEKIPKHLTVLLGTEEPSYHDLANFVLWCMAARISFITFYDHKGTLKRNESKLHQVIMEKKNEKDHVIFHNNPDYVYKNGFSGRKIHVKVLSKDDGKGAVVDLTRDFATKEDTNLTIDSFDQGLKKQFHFPDPELGVCCGKVFSLLAYPPWQIRVTEFLTLKSHHNVTFNDFVKLLCRYSKCEQRWGK